MWSFCPNFSERKKELYFRCEIIIVAVFEGSQSENCLTCRTSEGKFGTIGDMEKSTRTSSDYYSISGVKFPGKIERSSFVIGYLDCSRIARNSRRNLTFIGIIGEIFRTPLRYEIGGRI